MPVSKYAGFVVVCFILLAPCCLPQGNIIFTEDFEESSIQEAVLRWTEAANAAGMHFSTDVPPGSSGKQSLVMTAIIGRDTGGHLYKYFPEGYDSLFARFYVKFPRDHNAVHHFVHMGGYNPPTRWPQGGAGIRPAGNERFTSGIEPMGERWSWDFYTYWMHMRGNAQPNTYWGNIFNPRPPSQVKRGEWICVEFMIKVNNPIDRWNGEQAFWIDDRQVNHLGPGFPLGSWIYDKFYPDTTGNPFEGFQWRSDPDLRVNFFWLLYYMTRGPNGQTDSVLFDDIVISTRRIGPIPTRVEMTQDKPDHFSATLHPQPASGKVTLTIRLPLPQRLEIRIIDLLGRTRSVLRGLEWHQDGIHLLEFDAGRLCGSGGLFFVVVSASDRMFAKKLLVIPAVNRGEGVTR